MILSFLFFIPYRTISKISLYIFKTNHTISILLLLPQCEKQNVLKHLIKSSFYPNYIRFFPKYENDKP